MTRFRTRTAALVAALLLILAIGGVALATHWAPQATDGQARAQAASDIHDAGASDEDANDDSGAQGEHGAAVSAVAQDVTIVGGDQDNHGGAVSIVARDNNGLLGDEGESATHRQDGDHRP